MIQDAEMLFVFLFTFLSITHHLSLFRSSGIQEDSESEPTLPESISSAGPVDTVGRPSRSSALLSASLADRKVLR
jgi:hypothetical protein